MTTTDNRKFLSPAEALALIQSESLLEKLRLLVVDYMLLRASISENKSEKRAWWILYSLMAFVETRKHFPYKEEMYIYLDAVLRGGKTREFVLPKFSQADLLELRSLWGQIGVSLRDYVESKR